MCAARAALVLIALAAPAAAGAGTVVTDPEQPFCRERDRLVQYVTALIRGHEDRAALIPGCASVREGYKLEVIAVEPTSPIGSIARVRLIRPNGVAVEGYTSGPEPERP